MIRRTKLLLSRSVRSFLSAPRVARLSTIGKDGYPHTVPIDFARDGDDIVFGTDEGEQKVCNLRRNPKGAIVIGGDPATDDAGYLIQGDLMVEANPDPRTVKKILRRYLTERRAEEFMAESEGIHRVLIRLTPRKVIRVW